jgi:hypothetical protein
MAKVVVLSKKEVALVAMVDLDFIHGPSLSWADILGIYTANRFQVATKVEHIFTASTLSHSRTI